MGIRATLGVLLYLMTTHIRELLREYTPVIITTGQLRWLEKGRAERDQLRIDVVRRTRKLEILRKAIRELAPDKAKDILWQVEIEAAKEKY
jgi:hypothetical protein